MRVVLLCHVEPGTCRKRTIIYGDQYRGGIDIAGGRIGKFSDEHGIPMTFAMTLTALRRLVVDLSGHELGLHLHRMDEALRAACRGKVRLLHVCLAGYSESDQALIISAAKAVFEEIVCRLRLSLQEGGPRARRRSGCFFPKDSDSTEAYPQVMFPRVLIGVEFLGSRNRTLPT